MTPAKPFDWDAAFSEVAAETARKSDESEAFERSPAGIAKRQEEIAREIRQGLRDANGDWIEQPETDEDEPDDEEIEE